jgi:hypothetical protein
MNSIIAEKNRAALELKKLQKEKIGLENFIKENREKMNAYDDSILENIKIHNAELDEIIQKKKTISENEWMKQQLEQNKVELEKKLKKEYNVMALDLRKQMSVEIKEIKENYANQKHMQLKQAYDDALVAIEKVQREKEEAVREKENAFREWEEEKAKLMAAALNNNNNNKNGKNNNTKHKFLR